MARRLRGKKLQLTPTGKSVSVSFRVRVVRACVRACEAAWARVGMPPQRWRLGWQEVLRRGVRLFAYLQLYSWVLRNFLRCCCYVHGFFDRFREILAICVGFKLYDCFLGRSVCYMRGFFDLCWDILAIRMGLKSTDDLNSWSEQIISTADPDR